MIDYDKLILNKENGFFFISLLNCTHIHLKKKKKKNGKATTNTPTLYFTYLDVVVS